MSGGIAADAVLDYVTFQILQDNRYIALIHSNKEEEIVGRGLLNQLLDHLPSIQDQLADAPSDYLKLELSENADKRTWFTKATLTRFLHLVGSPRLEKSVHISNEISQLEESRNFHGSLYAKAEDGIVSSDNSKNELLRAMDTRISALMEDLVSTFNSVVGETVTFQEMVDLHEFCQQFADVDMSNLFLKLIKTSQIVAPSENKKSQVPFISQDDHTESTGGDSQLSESPYSVEAVKCIERQNSTESEDLGFSSEDEGPNIERSRTFIRPASPRRSASPMRRVQVGRSGPRRTPALTIKSLTSFPPAREGISSHSDCNSEEPEELDKRTEVNVMRISVQDAISLFEGKQRNEAVDSRSKRSFNDSSANTNKAVLMRWRSGMGEPQKSVTTSLSEQAVSEEKSELVKPEKGPDSENVVPETVEVELESETTNLNSDKVLVPELECTIEKLGSDECSRQKEEELNEVVVKHVEHDQTDLKKSETDSNKSSKSRAEKQKLKGEKPELRVKKKKVPEKQEAEKSAVKVNSDVGNKQSIRTKTQNVKKNEPVGLSSRKESPKPVESKRISSRKAPSPQPAVRKSWPSTPSPRGTGTLHGKVQAGAVSSATKAPQKSPQLAAPPQKPQSSPRVERSQIQHKAVRKPQVDAKRSSKAEGSKNQAVPKDGKPMKVGTVKDPKEEAKKGKPTEIRNATPNLDGSRSPAKVVVGHKRVTKKSSVVPLEAKPSPSKDPAGPATSKAEETPAQVEETWSKGEDPISTMQHDAGAVMSDNGHVESELEAQAEKANSSEEKEVSDETPCEVDDEVAERMAVSPAEIDPVQESVISPAAWEESPHQDPSVSSLNISPSPDTAASSEVETRARRSLSQMLVQESSEPDVVEWGNAEIPPTIVYQKDAPKGFKRLLKFARKNKGETNGAAWAAWASPYTSDGEDDGDDCRTLGKRTSDSLLRKVAVPSKSPAEGAPYDSEPLSAQSNINNRSARSSNKFQEGHGTTKGARSFFSLSAFRGHKS